MYRDFNEKVSETEDDSYAKRDPVCSVGVQHFKVHTVEGSLYLMGNITIMVILPTECVTCSCKESWTQNTTGRKHNLLWQPLTLGNQHNRHQGCLQTTLYANGNKEINTHAVTWLRVPVPPLYTTITAQQPWWASNTAYAPDLQQAVPLYSLNSIYIFM